MERTTTLSVEEFSELAQQPDYAGKQLELVEGRLIVTPPSSHYNSEVGVQIAFLIKQYLIEHNLGRISGADGGYSWAEGTVRAPDVGFTRYDSIPEDYTPGETTYLPVPPDLAVEIISPSDSPLEKARMYLEAGTRLVWNVYPQEQRVDVVTLVDGKLNALTHTTEHTLGGGDVLPGLEIAVGAIFP